MHRRRPTSTGNCRIASRNGSDSMSPTVPPISVIDEVDVARVGHQPDPLLDLVGDVRDDLDGRAEVVAAPLAPDHRVVDPAGGDVRGARRVRVGEALVVAEVEVGLGAVLGHEHLAVLVRRHRARVDVDVRVELLHLHVEPARAQQSPDRGGGDALPERRDHAARDEDELRFALRQTESVLPAVKCTLDLQGSQVAGRQSARPPGPCRNPRTLRSFTVVGDRLARPAVPADRLTRPSAARARAHGRRDRRGRPRASARARRRPRPRPARSRS